MSKLPRAPAGQSTAGSDHDRATLEHGRLATIGALTAGLGHDLRNAIAPALLRLDALAETNLAEGTHRELRAIRSSIGEMQHIAAGLHLLAADPATDAAVPLTTKLSNWWRDLAPLVHAAMSPGTLLHADIPETLGPVAVPPQVLAQVIMALAMNARELMQANTFPCISISARTAASGVLLTFEHAGRSPSSGASLGQPVDARPVDSPIEAISGLSLVQLQALLRAHDADLVLSEYSRDGGRFEIRLSVHSAAFEEADQATVAPHALDASFSVLCIDDNELLIDALESRLELEAGFTTLHRAVPLTDAVAMVARVRPTIVLLDYDLPDGIDALRVLARIVNDTPDSRVIMFTGFPNGQLVTESIALGAKGFVSKGIESDRLISAIHRVRGGEQVIELDA